jgi:hypothetical protein
MLICPRLTLRSAVLSIPVQPQTQPLNENHLRLFPHRSAIQLHLWGDALQTLLRCLNSRRRVLMLAVLAVRRADHRSRP